MSLRKTSLIAVVIVAFSLASCGTVRRAGKDASMVLLSPAVVAYGGFTDGYTSSQEVRDGLGGGAATQVVALPFTTLYHLGKHLVWTGVHLLDFVRFPIYGAAELHPSGPEIEPLDYYTGTIFDNPDFGQSGTDPESGEQR